MTGAHGDAVLDDAGASEYLRPLTAGGTQAGRRLTAGFRARGMLPARRVSDSTRKLMAALDAAPRRVSRLPAWVLALLALPPWRKRPAPGRHRARRASGGTRPATTPRARSDGGGVAPESIPASAFRPAPSAVHHEAPVPAPLVLPADVAAPDVAYSDMYPIANLMSDSFVGMLRAVAP